MFPLQYPSMPFRLKEEDGKKYVFDEIRKMWLIVTPEEWVRQHFVHYLILTKGYPMSFIALEKRIVMGELKKRFDILIYDPLHKPWMMIECKAVHIPLSESILQQVLRYNLAVPVPFMVITNGRFCSVFQKSGGHLTSLADLPDFPIISE